jgi:hypothetical protein
MAMRTADAVIAFLNSLGATDGNNYGGMNRTDRRPLGIGADEHWLLLTKAACDGDRKMFFKMLHHFNYRVQTVGVSGYDDSPKREIPSPAAAKEACNRYASGLKDLPNEIA